MKVRNLEEKPSSPNCECNSWIEHWKINSGKKVGICSALNCSNEAEVGGHIQKRNCGDDSWYIIPICKSCNGKLGQEYEVKEGTICVPIGRTNQCRQPSLIKTLKETN